MEVFLKFENKIITLTFFFYQLHRLLLSAINSKWGLNSYKHSVVNPSLIRYSNSMGFSGFGVIKIYFFFC
jgi:hypothetical protein